MTSHRDIVEVETHINESTKHQDQVELIMATDQTCPYCRSHRPCTSCFYIHLCICNDDIHPTAGRKEGVGRRPPSLATTEKEADQQDLRNYSGYVALILTEPAGRVEVQLVFVLSVVCWILLRH